MHQTITCKLKSSEKIFQDSFIPKIVILPFLSQKFTHDWQVNSLYCKLSPYDRAKEFYEFQFYYYPFKPEKTQTKMCMFLNHFSIFKSIITDLLFLENITTVLFNFLPGNFCCK